MSGTGAKFDRFLVNIQLTKPQIDDAITKHTGVRKALHSYYYSGAYDGSTSLLVGSYGKDTAVRPPSDIDILFKMPANLFDRYNSSSSNGQSQLLQDVKNVLKKTYLNTDMRGDGQVVMVPFVSFAVEVAPAFALSSGGYYIPDTHNGGSWKLSNPESEMKRLTDSNVRSLGKTVHLIKIMKVWKRACNVPIKSLALELMAVDFLAGWPYFDKSSTYYDWMIRDFADYMLQKVGGWNIVPGTTELYSYGDGWKSRVESALGKAKKACDYENDDQKDAEATAEWKKIFGDLFPG